MLKTRSQGWGRGLALGLRQMREIRALEGQGAAEVTQGAGPGVGQPLAGRGRSEDEVSHSTFVPAAL